MYCSGQGHEWVIDSGLLRNNSQCDCRGSRTMLQRHYYSGSPASLHIRIGYYADTLAITTDLLNYNPGGGVGGGAQ